MRKGILTWALLAVAYGLLAAAVTWPLVAHLGDSIAGDLADPLRNTWALWWNAHGVPLTSAWWDAPLFYPMHGALALSEHLLGISLVADPIQWCGGSPLIAYNIALFLSFVLSGLFAHLLAHAITERHDAALIAGLGFAFAPYRMAQLSHLQVLTSYWMPLTLLGLHQYVETGRRRWLAVFGMSALLQSLSNGYYVFYLSLFVAAWTLWHCRGAERRRHLPAILGTWLLSCLPLIPILLEYQDVHRELGTELHVADIQSLSADVSSLFAAPPLLAVWGAISPSFQLEMALFPGVALSSLLAIGLLATWHAAPRGSMKMGRLRLALTIVAVLFVISGFVVIIAGPLRVRFLGVLLSMTVPEKQFSPAFYLLAMVALTGPMIVEKFRRHSTFAFYVLMLTVSWILSFGPTVHAFGHAIWAGAPYQKLMLLPGFSQLRVPARLGMLAALSLATAAAISFSRVVPAASRRGALATCAVCVLILIEGWPARMPLYAPPERSALLEGAADSLPVLELPLGDVLHDCAAMYRSIYHRHPLINGYTGHFPPHYTPLRAALIRRDPAVLQILGGLGRSYVVLDRQADQAGRTEEFLSHFPGLRQVRSDREQVLYTLERSKPLVLPDPRTFVTFERLSDNVDGKLLSNLRDNDMSTRWGTTGGQRGNEELVLDLGAPQQVSDVVLYLGPYLSEFPRRLVAEVAGEAGGWKRAYAGTTAALAYWGALQSPREVPLVIPCRARTARVRLLQTGKDPFFPWSIAEIRIVGSAPNAER